MKAVVLDISDGEATVMTKSGDIIGVRDDRYDIGQEITVKGSLGSNIVRFMPAIAAAAVRMIMAGTGSYAYLSPYGTVSLDVNPSIEYSINRFDKVLSVSGVNDDGSDIVSSLDVSRLKYKDIETAIDNTIDQIDAEGYFTEDSDNYVVVTANTGADAHTDKLVERLDKTVAKHEGIRPITSKVSDDELRNAHEQGISAGKKMMVDRLDDISDDTIDRDKWNGKSVRDIVDEYDRIKNEKEEPKKNDINTDPVPDNESNTGDDILNGSGTDNMDNGQTVDVPEEKPADNENPSTDMKPADNEKPSADMKPAEDVNPLNEGRQGGSDRPSGSNVVPSDMTEERNNNEPPADNGNMAPPQGDTGNQGYEGNPAPPDENADPGPLIPGGGNGDQRPGDPEEPQNGGDRGGMDNPPDNSGDIGGGQGPQGGPGAFDGGRQ
ncbi:MAG: hypothetical protein K6E53_05385 [Lachnospiraceae bacterium]|nr:hypothetical protein [Lachnospiraceae bacterium]